MRNNTFGADVLQDQHLHRLAGSGDRWRGTLSVPRFIGNEQVGLWVAWTANENTDPSSQKSMTSRVDTARLRAKGLPASLKLVSGPKDVTKPVFLSSARTPKEVDTTSGPATVTFTVHAYDAQSGIGQIPDDLGGEVLTPKFGSDVYRVRPSTTVTGFHRVAKRTWRQTYTVPECTAGTLTVGGGVSIIDRLLNWRGPRIASNVHVTETGDISPPGVAGAQVSDGGQTVSVNFDEGVKDITTSNITLYDGSQVDQYDTAPDQGSYDSPPPTPISPTAVACFNSGAALPCDGSDGLITQAVLSVSPSQALPGYRLDVNDLGITPQVTDGSGNPVPWGATFQTN